MIEKNGSVFIKISEVLLICEFCYHWTFWRKVFKRLDSFFFNMEAIEKLGIQDLGRNDSVDDISPACREVLNIFSRSHNPYLTIRRVSTDLNISYQAAKTRLHRLVNKSKIQMVYPGAYCLVEKREKIELFPFYVKMNKHFTITIPARIINLRKLKNRFVKIIIENNNCRHIFLTKTYYNLSSRQTYAFINEEIREKLNIKANYQLKIIDIGRISLFKPKENISYGGQIDFLSLIPGKTKKGFDFFVEEYEKNNEKWINMWYHSKNCGAKQVWIRRFVNPEKLGKILGIFQAEGNKFEEIKSTQSVRLIFTNKSISEHRQFIDILSEFGVPKDIIKVKVHYNPDNVAHVEYKCYVDRFEELTGIRPRTYTYTNNKKLYYAAQIEIGRAALAELFLNAMHQTRTIIANEKFDTVLQELGENFLAKLLTGDGCLVTVKRKRGYVTQGYVSDKNFKYRKDYRKILRRFGISVARWDDGQRVYFKCNNENLKFLYKIKAFEGTRSWRKLLMALLFKNKVLYQRFKRLSKFSHFTNEQFAGIFGISIKAAALWIRDKRRKNYINLLKVDKNKHFYALSSKAKDLLKILDNCNSELRKGCKDAN